MKISDTFPSKYLKAIDLQGRHILVRIERVELEDLGNDTKPVAYFVGKSKGVVLNKTNATMIAAFYGDDTTEWRDKEIVLFSEKVPMQGRIVDAIRVRAPNTRSMPRDPISSGRQSDDFESGLPDEDWPS